MNNSISIQIGAEGADDLINMLENKKIFKEEDEERMKMQRDFEDPKEASLFADQVDGIVTMINIGKENEAYRVYYYGGED